VGGAGVHQFIAHVGQRATSMVVRIACAVNLARGAWTPRHAAVVRVAYVADHECRKLIEQRRSVGGRRSSTASGTSCRPIWLSDAGASV
jgi:hypothetical protein